MSNKDNNPYPSESNSNKDSRFQKDQAMKKLPTNHLFLDESPNTATEESDCTPSEDLNLQKGQKAMQDPFFVGSPTNKFFWRYSLPLTSAMLLICAYLYCMTNNPAFMFLIIPFMFFVGAMIVI